MKPNARRTTRRLPLVPRKVLLAPLAIAALFALASGAWAGPYVYVLNHASQDVSVIDLHTRSVTATVPVRWPGDDPELHSLPTDLILHPFRSELYVLTDRYVTIINTDTLDPAHSRFVALQASEPRGFALDDIGFGLFVSFKNSPMISRIQIGSWGQGAFTAQISDIRHLTTNDAYMWGVNDAGDLLRVDLGGFTQDVVVSGIFSEPRGLAVSADGLDVLIASKTQKGVHAVDVNTAMLPANASGAARLVDNIAPGRVRALLSGEDVVTWPNDDQVVYLANTNLSLPNGSSPSDVGDNELGTLAVSLRDAHSARIYDTAGGVVDVPVGTSPFAVAMGIGDVGELRISPDPVKFSYLNAGDVVRRTVTIESTGDAAVNISSIRVSTGAPFRLVRESCPAALAPGDRCVADVEFTAPASSLSTSCKTAIKTVACYSGIATLASYKGWLEVNNDAALHPVGGVTLWAGRFAVEELIGTPLEVDPDYVPIQLQDEGGR